ncbi:hypothetical protein SB2_06690 [Methylobacterium radiotolerans]|uniref:hypothetical protein n=1 Tax=Methylobacterium sp. B1 TaxID=91459 RepID=UPI000347F77E|nr:hypothetical protein [Methylobacterium sp. B1]KTS10237.1 hypothetical protein SB3_08735 [Methylobacterium radiotolerans]KTS49242.1 hypothetical protein SB2_06690 [Methylobacterium radiotolerans]
MTLKADDGADATILSNVNLLNYRVESLEKKLDQFLVKIESNYTTKSELKEVRDDLEKLSAHLSWIVKIIIGAVVVALLSVVIVKGGVPH